MTERTTSRRVRSPRPIEERFWAKVEKTDTCWLWTGALNERGYGLIGRGKHAGGGLVRVHRLSYEMHIGPIPRGHVIDHRCHTTICVNPAHLQAVTPQQNGENRGVVRSSTGIRGVYRDKRNGRFRVGVARDGRHHYGGSFIELKDAEAAAIALRNELMTNNLIDRQAG